jgi:hypothetical protein
MVTMPIWGGWPLGTLLPPFLTSYYGNGRTKFPKKKAERRLSLSSNRSARRGNTKIGQSLSPREQAAQIQKRSVRLESNNPAAQLVVNTFSEKIGHTNCVFLRELCKASIFS